MGVASVSVFLFIYIYDMIDLFHGVFYFCPQTSGVVTGLSRIIERQVTGRRRRSGNCVQGWGSSQILNCTPLLAPLPFCLLL